jgi:hypothetical protein
MAISKRPALKSDDAEAFIRGADTHQEEPAQTPPKGNDLPWRDANPRIKKGINLRLDEVQWAKLKFISENSPLSIQKFIMSVLEPAINEEIHRLVNEK